MKFNQFKQIFNLTNKKRLKFSTSSQKIQNYYELLEVPNNASIDQIKKAYFIKAKKYHPDVSQEQKQNEELFKEINKAYETLKDPAKRQIYDLGQRNPFFSEEADPEKYTQYYREQTQKQSNWRESKYYENKWYDFRKKGAENDLRDEYYKNAQENLKQQEWAIKQTAIRVAFVIGAWFAFDFFNYYKESIHKQFISQQRQIFKQGFQENPVLIIDSKNQQQFSLSDYIEERQTVQAEFVIEDDQDEN